MGGEAVIRLSPDLKPSVDRRDFFTLKIGGSSIGKTLTLEALIRFWSISQGVAHVRHLFWRSAKMAMPTCSIGTISGALAEA